MLVNALTFVSILFSIALFDKCCNEYDIGKYILFIATPEGSVNTSDILKLHRLGYSRRLLLMSLRRMCTSGEEEVEAGTIVTQL